METKLEDVIHLYLGCEVQTKKIAETEQGMPMKRLKGILSDVDLLMGENKYGIHLENEKHPTDTTNFAISDFKPILRKLEDITEEEQAVWDSTDTPIGEMHIQSALQIHWAKRINYYRSIFIDCDGLIEAGLAIDRKTLNEI